jgi:hypothetical protein
MAYIEIGTIIKTSMEDFEVKADIDTDDIEMVKEFIKDTPWNKIKIKGVEDNRDKINTTMSCYSCIEDFLQCLELNPPQILYLQIGKEKLSLRE